MGAAFDEAVGRARALGLRVSIHHFEPNLQIGPHGETEVYVRSRQHTYMFTISDRLEVDGDWDYSACRFMELAIRQLLPDGKPSGQMAQAVHDWQISQMLAEAVRRRERQLNRFRKSRRFWRHVDWAAYFRDEMERGWFPTACFLQRDPNL